MSIYSNYILPRSLCLQFYQLTRPYHGRWYNFNLYSAVNNKRLLLHSQSPLTLFEKNRNYYCYQVFDNYPPGHFGNELFTYDNYNKQLKLYMPCGLSPGDILIVNEDITAHYYSIHDISHINNTFIVLQ